MDEDDIIYPNNEEGFRIAVRVSIAKARISLARIQMALSTIVWLLGVIAGLLFFILLWLSNAG